MDNIGRIGLVVLGVIMYILKKNEENKIIVEEEFSVRCSRVFTYFLYLMFGGGIISIFYFYEEISLIEDAPLYLIALTIFVVGTLIIAPIITLILFSKNYIIVNRNKLEFHKVNKEVKYVDISEIIKFEYKYKKVIFYFNDETRIKYDTSYMMGMDTLTTIILKSKNTN